MTIEINGEKKNYTVTRRRGMKSVRIRLGDDGVFRVSAPYGVSADHIRDLIRKSSDKLYSYKKGDDQSRKRWEDFVREKIKNVPDWQVRRLGDDIVAGKPYEKGSIYNGISICTTQIEFQNLFWRSYRRFRADHAAPVTNVCFQHMVSRWGSCRPKTGRLTFNLLLLYVPGECAEYVIYHELCHFLEANHSKRFWEQVAVYVPDYKKIEKELNDYGKILIERRL